MKKNEKDKVNRIAFVNLCIDSPEKGSEYLSMIAKKIGKAKSTVEVVGCLRDILFLSECTIYRDLSR